jgi:hypothetical protein
MFRAAEIMRALPEGVAKVVAESGVGGRATARFIIMAAHEISLGKWLVGNRDTIDFIVVSRLCKQFAEVRCKTLMAVALRAVLCRVYV